MRRVRGGLLGAAGGIVDALMAALVAAALAQIGDRPAWLVAILADRYHKPLAVLAAATLAIVAASMIAVAGGVLLAPMLTPAARQTLLALALLLQGGGAILPVKGPERLDRGRLGVMGTSFLGSFILAFGDGLQFVVLALAARSPTPWLAPVGAGLGVLAVFAPAALLGEREWTAMPLGKGRIAIGVVFVLVGLLVGLGALRLI